MIKKEYTWFIRPNPKHCSPSILSPEGVTMKGIIRHQHTTTQLRKTKTPTPTKKRRPTQTGFSGTVGTTPIGSIPSLKSVSVYIYKSGFPYAKAFHYHFLRRLHLGPGLGDIPAVSGRLVGDLEDRWKNSYSQLSPPILSSLRNFQTLLGKEF